MKETRVLLIHNIITPHTTPLFGRLSVAADNFSLKVLYCSESDENRFWKVEKGSFDYKILPAWSLRFRGKDLFTYFVNPTIIFELLRESPDVIIASGWDSFACEMAFFYAKIFRKKFIIWSGSTKYEKSWRRVLAGPLVKIMVSGSDACVAYGTRAKEYLISLGAEPGKIFIAPNTTDTSFFQREVEKWGRQKPKIKGRLGIKTSKVILYVGRLTEIKGVEYLVEAFGRLKKEFAGVSLLIVGYGPLEDELKNMVRRRKISDVIFAGGVEWKETPKFYVTADILVMPSLEEVWGLVINEALAAGLPVITTDRVGASVDLVKNGENGFIIKPGSSEQLYLALKKILGNGLVLERMSRNSRLAGKMFSRGKTLEGIRRAINHVRG